MTEDTKRALEAIRPIAEILNIKVDAYKNTLIMGDDAIGIACNSTYATVMEALGYMFLKEYPRFRYAALIPMELEEDIKRYWVSREALARFMEENNAEIQKRQRENSISG